MSLAKSTTHKERFFIKREQTVAEEIINTATHAAGLCLAIIGFTFSIMLADETADLYKIVGISLFNINLILMYLASTLYHGSRSRRFKPLLQRFDHLMIYGMIAGSYSPIVLVNLREHFGWEMFVVIWLLALIGMIGETIYGTKFERFSLIFYLGMGWMVLVIWDPLLHYFPFHGILWLLLGGLFYTAGAFFYVWSALPYHHGIWHLTVIGGSFTHFLTVLWYVLPNSGVVS